ncbi:hypothetical protein GCM10011371_15850 [Novosphingobium marinum]|uniref:VCBS repeat-containing protein n=1 Tax=Novosphingobium marinum TaxID=1514948 RepID=A0A7Y9XW51_9SPHN|nr:tandem-95 repeat protein [Novosphingobium marinum]NYH95699.1 VCBS repeat-containing protein [Novosphingobium marinum]GGC29163.1 hypothetical protein GCM10011371_15850 [Novosphingobium marinum]
MTKTVVPAAAKAKAKQLVSNEKLTKQAKAQAPAKDDDAERVSHEPDEAQAVQTEEAKAEQASMSDTSLAGDFSFAGALAAAAESTSELTMEIGEAQDEGYSDYDDDDGGANSTILLIGAVALVGLGIAVLVGGDDDDEDIFVNEDPVFGADTYTITVDEDDADGASVTVAATDPDGNALTYSISSDPANGTVTVGDGGVLTYVPNADFSGTDSFEVTVSDGNGGTDTATVNVTVNPVNDAPVLGPDATTEITVAEDGQAELILDVVDPDGDDVEIVSITGPTNGTIVYDAATDTEFYVPNPDFNGTDTITVVVTDGTEQSTFTIPITVTPVNDDPEFAAEEVTINTVTGVTFSGTVMATDVDGDDLTYELGTDATNGEVVVNDDGTYTYTANAGFVGMDTYSVLVSDGNGGTDELTVNVNVLANENNAPDFGVDEVDISVEEGDVFEGTLAATDEDGDDLTYALDTQATNGTAVVNADGTYTYTPNADFVGEDSYVVSVSDGNGGTDTLTVNVTVTEMVLEETVSVDVVGEGQTAVDLEEGIDFNVENDDPVVFTDDADESSLVNIIGFEDGDIIAVTGATSGDYNFGTGDGGNDLEITFTSGSGATNEIVLDDFLVGSDAIIFNYDTAVQAVGYDFITFA